MLKISGPVGPRQANRAEDVRAVQELLNRNPQYLSHHRKLTVDGRFGPSTEEVIKNVQRGILKSMAPDGIVSPGGPTLLYLSSHAGPAFGGSTSLGVTATLGGLSNSDFVEIARTLGCETAAVKAVVETEVGIRGPFDAQGRPTVLFERHVFSRLTGGKYDKSYPDISNKVAGGYGHFSEQYEKLERASKLDKTAALQSASWGAFQIMGENNRQAGFQSVDDFVSAMKLSVQKQSVAFINFIKNDHSLTKSLQHKHWREFARIYNGPAYQANNYDTKMRQNYDKIMHSR